MSVLNLPKCENPDKVRSKTLIDEDMALSDKDI